MLASRGISSLVSHASGLCGCLSSEQLKEFCFVLIFKASHIRFDAHYILIAFGRKTLELEFKVSLVFLNRNQVRGYRQEPACLSGRLCVCKKGTEVDNISYIDAVSAVTVASFSPI